MFSIGAGPEKMRLASTKEYCTPRRAFAASLEMGMRRFGTDATRVGYRMTRKADDLRTVLDGLADTKLEFVFARSKTNKTIEALREIGVSRNTFYKWPDRERLEELAQELKRRRLLRVEMMIQDAAEDAARVKVEGLKSKKDHIKQAVATEILDRTVGSPAKRVDVHSSGEVAIVLEWDNANADDNLAEAS